VTLMEPKKKEKKKEGHPAKRGEIWSKVDNYYAFQYNEYM